MEEIEQVKTNRSKRLPSENSSLGEGQSSGFLEDISPVPSPDYDAPSPEADELELQLPDDTNQIGSNMGGSIQSSGTPTPTTSPSQSLYTHQQNILELGRNGTITSGGGDLNSRLDCMRSSMTSLKVGLSGCGGYFGRP